MSIYLDLQIFLAFDIYQTRNTIFHTYEMISKKKLFPGGILTS